MSRGRSPRLYFVRRLGERVVVDVASGNFFSVDAAAAEALRLIEKGASRPAAAYLTRHGAAKGRAAWREAMGAVEDGQVLAPRPRSSTRLERPHPTDVTLNLVGRCNLRCIYCWNGAGDYGRRRAQGAMAVETARAAVDLLVAESGSERDLVVDFYGGEPLLALPVLLATVDHCRGIARRTKKRFAFLLATNGTLLDGEAARALAAAKVNVAVSLDGPAEVHDRQRPFENGGPSHARILANLLALPPALRERVVLRATATPLSPDLLSTFRGLRALGFSRIEVCESEDACYQGGPTRARSFFGSPDLTIRLQKEWTRLVRFYLAEASAGRLHHGNTFFNRFFKLVAHLHRAGSFAGPCSAGLGQLAVDEDGRVYPCTAFVGIDDFVMGDVRRGLDRRVQDTFFETRITDSEECGRCWARALCEGSGSCFNLNFFHGGRIDHPEPWFCAQYRHRLELALAFLGALSARAPERLPGLLGKGPARRGEWQASPAA